MVISIRNTECVRCREVVRFSEGPLSEVRLTVGRVCLEVDPSYESISQIGTPLYNGQKACSQCVRCSEVPLYLPYLPYLGMIYVICVTVSYSNSEGFRSNVYLS